LPSVAHFVASGVAPDDKGLVAAVTTALREQGCNVEAARMATFGGHFSMTLVVSTTTPEATLRAKLATFEGSHGLVVTLTPVNGYGGRATRAATHEVAVVTPCDEPGVLAAISEALFKYDVNIVDLHTTASATRCVTTMTVWLPDGLSHEDCQHLLDQELAAVRGDAEVRFVEVQPITPARRAP